MPRSIRESLESQLLSGLVLVVRERGVRPLLHGFDPIRGTDRLIIQEAAQFSGARRMLQLAQRLCLDLADALAGHRELLAYLLQRVVGVHTDAETHAQHALLARGE